MLSPTCLHDPHMDIGVHFQAEVVGGDNDDVFALGVSGYFFQRFDAVLDDPFGLAGIDANAFGAEERACVDPLLDRVYTLKPLGFLGCRQVVGKIKLHIDQL